MKQSNLLLQGIFVLMQLTKDLFVEKHGCVLNA